MNTLSHVPIEYREAVVAAIVEKFGKLGKTPPSDYCSMMSNEISCLVRIKFDLTLDHENPPVYMLVYYPTQKDGAEAYGFDYASPQ